MTQNNIDKDALIQEKEDSETISKKEKHQK